MKALLALVLIALVPALTSAQSHLFGPPAALPQEPPVVVVTTPEARRLAKALSNGQAIAEMNLVLSDEIRLERSKTAVALGAAAKFEEASHEQAKRADAEAARADAWSRTASTETALKEQALGEVKRERRRGRWNLVKGVVVGAVIGLGVGAAAVLAGR